MKVVINDMVGGFQLDLQSIVEFLTRKGIKFEVEPRASIWRAASVKIIPSGGEEFYYFSYNMIERNDPDFVEMVQTMDDRVINGCCHLKIVDIPDGIDWIVLESEDGSEYVAEKFRTWY